MTVSVTVTCKSTLKDTKEGKEGKEFAKEFHKEHKEFFKDVAPDKNLVKDHKEVHKEAGKESGFEGWPPGGWRPGGGGFGGRGANAQSVEDRLNVLEAVVFGDGGAGGGDQGAEMFIDASLRPDLMGATGTATSASLQERMSAGDAGAKREFDTPAG